MFKAIVRAAANRSIEWTADQRFTRRGYWRGSGGISL